MKLVNLIKADFFINPENYGYHIHDDIEAIWHEIIKPLVKTLEPGCSNIDNTYIHSNIEIYRRDIMEAI